MMTPKLNSDTRFYTPIILLRSSIAGLEPTEYPRQLNIAIFTTWENTGVRRQPSQEFPLFLVFPEFDSKGSSGARSLY